MDKPWCKYCSKYYRNPRYGVDYCHAMKYRDEITGQWQWVYGNPGFRGPQQAMQDNLCKPKLNVKGRIRKLFGLQIGEKK